MVRLPSACPSRVFLAVIVIFASSLATVSRLSAQEAVAEVNAIASPVRTDSPRDTFATFERLSEVAKSTVKRWRSAGRLPFPRLPRDEIERLEGTLDYPPYGSPEASQEDLEAAAVAAEPLSSSPEPTDEPAERETGLAKQPVT